MKIILKISLPRDNLRKVLLLLALKKIKKLALAFYILAQKIELVGLK